MDKMGVEVQVLSLTTPGTHVFSPSEATHFARRAMMRRPKPSLRLDRLQAFAMVAMNSPEKAVSELKRCVEELGFPGLLLNGRTGSRNIDHPIFETAAKLKIPVYIHPQMPADAVREAYYSDFDPMVNSVFAGAAFGWHAETGIQAIRLILAGIYEELAGCPSGLSSEQPQPLRRAVLPSPESSFRTSTRLR